MSVQRPLFCDVDKQIQVRKYVSHWFKHILIGWKVYRKRYRMRLKVRHYPLHSMFLNGLNVLYSGIKYTEKDWVRLSMRHYHLQKGKEVQNKEIVFLIDA